MDVEKFRKASIGHLVTIRGEDAYGRSYDHFAYVPDPLPNRIKLKDETWMLLTEAVLQLGHLGGAGKRLPNPSLIARPVIRAEAVSSSALEGTYTTIPQVLQSELFQDTSTAETTEVLDQIRAFELGVGAVSAGQPLGINLIKRLHGVLMQNDPRWSANDKGEFRARQNFIGQRRARIEDAIFVPPPPEEVQQNINAWESWMHDERAGHVLVRAAVSHYQFETIHPFIDGNGRLGRLIVLLLLLHDGKTLSQPLLNISPYLHAHKDAYQEHLRKLSVTGDFDPWVCFFLEGIRHQAQAAFTIIEDLRSVAAQMVDGLRAHNVRGTAIRLAEDAIGFPLVTVPDVRDRYGITYQGASQAINVMVEQGYFQKVAVVGNRRFFFCQPILNVIQNAGESNR